VALETENPQPAPASETPPQQAAPSSIISELPDPLPLPLDGPNDTPPPPPQPQPPTSS
jgi:hypothetical protein